MLSTWGRSEACTAPFSLTFPLGEASAAFDLELLLVDLGVVGASDSVIGVSVVEMLAIGFVGVLFTSRAIGGVCNELGGGLSVFI